MTRASRVERDMTVACAGKTTRGERCRRQVPVRPSGAYVVGAYCYQHRRRGES